MESREIKRIVLLLILGTIWQLGWTESGQVPVGFLERCKKRFQDCEAKLTPMATRLELTEKALEECRQGEATNDTNQPGASETPNKSSEGQTPDVTALTAYNAKLKQVTEKNSKLIEDVTQCMEGGCPEQLPPESNVNIRIDELESKLAQCEGSIENKRLDDSLNSKQAESQCQEQLSIVKGRLESARQLAARSLEAELRRYFADQVCESSIRVSPVPLDDSSEFTAVVARVSVPNIEAQEKLREAYTDQADQIRFVIKVDAFAKYCDGSLDDGWLYLKDTKGAPLIQEVPTATDSGNVYPRPEDCAQVGASLDANPKIKAWLSDDSGLVPRRLRFWFFGPSGFGYCEQRNSEWISEYPQIPGRTAILIYR